MTKDEVPTGFARWWAAWPGNLGRYQRKGGRAQCLKKWVTRHHESQADTIIKHTEWMKTTPDWLKDGGAFIPMPVTYLNQQRWDGADIPHGAAAETDVEATARYLREQSAHEERCRLAPVRRRSDA